ncbi:MAG: ASKHA domain-containing protein [Thermodesulfobacteriota bacterium]|nr:ASKHA domain-containing protein [Thermodesulfobacteriota bacterium]
MNRVETNNKNNLWVKTVSVPPPTLQNNTADADRLLGVLQEQLKTDAIDIDPAVLKKLPDCLRNWGYHLSCVLCKDRKRWVLTGIKSLQDTTPFAGMAVDLGTSRVSLRLLDLATEKVLAESSFENPQVVIGPDILERIHFADHDEGLEKLNKLIISGLNHMIESLCASCNLDPDNVNLISVAGNTAMTHLFMGLNPHWIIREPYIPVINRPGLLRAKDLGIRVNPGAGVFIFPNIGSYFGGDLIAGILFSEMFQMENTAILVDVGTNAEVVLGNKNWLVGCAGAAGPALEGGVSKMGMMAGPGVIDQISIEPKTLNFEINTIDNQPPKGICGSGVIDLAAHLFLSGMIDIRGRLLPEVCKDRIKNIDGILHLVVVPAEKSSTGSDLTISQADLDSLIRSKAAMYTILETITSSVGMSPGDLSTFFVAGTFGSFINPVSAISIGMLPDLPANAYKSLGNSSLGGATLLLTSNNSCEKIAKIRDRITYLELNVNQEFMNRFSAAKFLPHTDLSLFPSVKI